MFFHKILMVVKKNLIYINLFKVSIISHKKKYINLNFYSLNFSTTTSPFLRFIVLRKLSSHTNSRVSVV